MRVCFISEGTPHKTGQLALVPVFEGDDAMAISSHRIQEPCSAKSVCQRICREAAVPLFSVGDVHLPRRGHALDAIPGSLVLLSQKSLTVYTALIVRDESILEHFWPGERPNDFCGDGHFTSFSTGE